MNADTAGSIDVAVVGLGFGAEFAPLYAAHPHVRRVALVDPDAQLLSRVGDRLGIEHRYTDVADLLASGQWDAVHLLSPVAAHAEQAIAVLNSGRHCACAVPMATELDDLNRIVAAAHDSGRTYMMAETAVYAREYFYVAELLSRGELGRPTFYTGAHIQDLDGYAPYWQGYPPMKYLTHALSPGLALTRARVDSVRSVGSGRLDRPSNFDNPFPVESGLFMLDRDGLAAQITVAFFATARSFYEGFSLYGSRGSIEWPQDDGPVVTYRFGERPAGARGRPVTATRVEPPDRTDLLPAELAPFTRPASYQPPGGRPAVRCGGGHGGSHPHLVHAFVRSIVDGEPPLVGPVAAADWTAPGICAHASAMAGGAAVDVPRFA